MPPGMSRCNAVWPSRCCTPRLAADAGFLRRFRAEAQAAAALTDPHVLAVYDWGEDSEGPSLVLEFLGGGSLRDLLDNHPPLSVSQAVSVGIQAAEGLAYAHGRGFVHRDVKPANLLFDESGRPPRRRLRVGARLGGGGVDGAGRARQWGRPAMPLPSRRSASASTVVPMCIRLRWCCTSR